MDREVGVVVDEDMKPLDLLPDHLPCPEEEGAALHAPVGAVLVSQARRKLGIAIVDGVAQHQDPEGAVGKFRREV